MSFSETLSLVASLAVLASYAVGFYFIERGRPALAILECDVADVGAGVL